VVRYEKEFDPPRGAAADEHVLLRNEW